MNILNREELCQLIKDTACIKSEVIQKDILESFDKDSSLQPCSVDLHIGEMYVPEKEDKALGGKTNPNKSEVILKPGGSLLYSLGFEVTI